MADCGVSGRGQQLQDAFGTLLIANGGLPTDAALFSQRSDDYETVTYYFSPAAMWIAKVLMENYGAVPCTAPSQGSVNLTVGDASALEMLPLE